MKHCLLGVAPPTGVTPPAPDALAAITRDAEALDDELRAAGARVFSRRSARPADRHRTAPRGRRGTTLPIEVRPFVGRHRPHASLSSLTASRCCPRR
ncbi:hypothetical protein ACWGLF_23750 [Streptomyces puniciscabiei]